MAMATSRKRKRLLDAYRFAGFRPQESVRGVFGDSKARVIVLVRRPKKPSARNAVAYIRVGTIARPDKHETCPAATRVSTWSSRFDGSAARALVR